MIPLLAACTLGAGVGFTEVGEASLVLGIVPGEARDLGDRTILLASGEELRVNQAQLEVLDVELRELQGGGSGETFDPANPPEGYSLCHNGHCHAADGSLPSYAEIEADLAGGDASFVAVRTWPVDTGVDLWESEVLDITPDDNLLAGESIRQVAIILGTGEVDLETPEGPLLLTLDSIGAVTADLEITADRDAASQIDISLSWTIEGDSFDGLDWTNPTTAETLTQRWQALRPETTLEEQ